MTTYSPAALYYERQRREADAAYAEWASRQSPECARCGHREDYHGTDHCGQEVCSYGEHPGGGWCDNEMHGNGWCQCPGYVAACGCCGTAFVEREGDLCNDCDENIPCGGLLGTCARGIEASSRASA